MVELEEEVITNFAQVYHKSQNEFFKILQQYLNLQESIGNIQLNQEGDFYYEAAVILLESYPRLGLNCLILAVQHFTKQNNKYEESRCYIAMGIAFLNLGIPASAIKFFELAKKIKQDLNDPDGIFTCYGNLVLAHHLAGNFQKAVEYGEVASRIAKEKQHKDTSRYHTISALYLNMSNLYNNFGDFRKAVEYGGMLVQIGNENRENQDILYGRIAIANAYCNLGDYEKAIFHYSIALEMSKKCDDYNECVVSINLGLVNTASNQLSEAIIHLQGALRIAEKKDYIILQVQCHNNLGLVYLNQKDPVTALDHFHKALVSAGYLDDREIEARIAKSVSLMNIGMIHFFLLRNRNEASKYLNKALGIAEKIRDIHHERVINLYLGVIHSEQDHHLAYKFLKRSIELGEVIGKSLIEEEHMLSFYSLTSNTYHLIVPICVKQGEGKEALEYVERSKSRTFIDILAATHIRPTKELTDESKALFEREEEILAKIRAIQTRNLQPIKIPLEPSEVDCILDEREKMYSKIENIDPEYVFIRRGRPAFLKQIQEILQRRKDVVLVEYFIATDKIFIFLVTRNELHIKTVELSTEQLVDHIKIFLRNLRDFSQEKYNPAVGNELSKYLIDPIAEYLPKADLICFIPFGLLHYVPLHILLLSNGEPIIKSCPVVYSPSASLLQFYNRKGSNRLRNCASFGVDFPWEANEVAELFDTDSFINATKPMVLGNAYNKDILHFSCHGFFDKIDPLSSGLLLYDNEYSETRDILTAREIFNLRLNAELVTLSACETGINERTNGDELIGLTRAFLYAGAASVLVSLWKVNAPSTQMLMKEFYNQLKAGEDKASALQLAQIKIMNRNGWEHPHYWAPFVLVGDWE